MIAFIGLTRVARARGDQFDAQAFVPRNDIRRSRSVSSDLLWQPANINRNPAALPCPARPCSGPARKIVPRYYAHERNFASERASYARRTCQVPKNHNREIRKAGQRTPGLHYSGNVIARDIILRYMRTRYSGMRKGNANKTDVPFTNKRA